MLLAAMCSRKKITISTLRARKRERQKISMLTCYDYTTARLMEEAQVDSLLLGDTYAEVCLGHPTTLPATIDHLVTVAEAVRRGAPTAYLVGDMPFLSYQVCVEEAIRNAGLFMAKAGCDCVKVEVDRRLVKTVEAMTTASIPVMAHLGLKPQSIQSLGAYMVQGKMAADALRIIEDAKMMEVAGAIALLLEAVPMELARIITESTTLPVIGCVSGPYCDGQVVVLHDMLGYGAGHPPRSVKQYAHLRDQLVAAFRSYATDVKEGAFPVPDASASMKPAQLEELNKTLEELRAHPKECGTGL
ncbi:MAG: 3-methyl-2-oxobutanoate hydroxymethyltransferase [Planctomycetota bacterium]|jgi:3-methyl-2-oxobutanoate hydroxymethyltransferase